MYMEYKEEKDRKAFEKLNTTCDNIMDYLHQLEPEDKPTGGSN